MEQQTEMFANLSTALLLRLDLLFEGARLGDADAQHVGRVVLELEIEGTPRKRE